MLVTKEIQEKFKAELNKFLELRGINMDTVLTAYESGNFPRSESVKDLHKRMAFDLFYVINKANDYYFSDAIRDIGGNNDHIYTMLKKVIPAVTRKY